MDKRILLRVICFVFIYNVFLGGISYYLAGWFGVFFNLCLITLACIVGLIIGGQK